jgi:release factor glutamine methyltransferase
MNSRCAPKPNVYRREKRTTNNLAGWLQHARRLAPSTGTSQEVGLLEASLLAAIVLERPRAWILAHPEHELEPTVLERLENLLSRLLTGEPLAYLTGRREFYGLDFLVTPAVLVPRPETELLVETAVEWLRANPDRGTAVDVGAGSGCIAIALAKQVPHLQLTAVDRSPAALETAAINAAAHRVAGRIALVQGDLLSAFAGPFDLICANLPYIPSADSAALPVSRFEPLLALDGGPDGLDLIRRLLAQIPRCLAPGGLALLEIEYRQGAQVQSLARTALPDARVSCLPDLAGLDRLIRIEA